MIIFCILTISIIFNLGLIVILKTPLVELLYKPLVKSDELIKGEWIIVIPPYAGIFDTPNGTLDFQTYLCVKKAFELYQSEYGKYIFCLGDSKVLKSDKFGSEIMKKYLMQWGIPENKIFRLDENAIYGWRYEDNIKLLVKQYQNKINFHNAVFVTYPQGTFLFKKYVEKEIGSPVCMVSAEPLQLNPKNWHHRFENFRDIFNEYYAIIEAYCRGWIK